jgi:hypothetical protein
MRGLLFVFVALLVIYGTMNAFVLAKKEYFNTRIEYFIQNLSECATKTVAEGCAIGFQYEDPMCIELNNWRIFYLNRSLVLGRWLDDENILSRVVTFYKTVSV